MANWFRSSRANNNSPVAATLRVQASVQGTPIPIGCGQTRWAGVLIDYDGFTATPAKSPGSKGGLAGAAGKGDTGQYNYTVSGLMLLGEGPITSVNTIYNGNALDFLVTPTTQMLADLEAIGIDPTTISEGNATYNTIFHSGTYTQTADSWWSANFAAHALAYRGLSYLIFPSLGLGSSPSFPAFNFECLWGLNTDISALGPDANPADWIEAFLTNPDWGVTGFPSAAIGDFDTARNYWRATGMLISMALTSASAANSHLSQLMTALNADFRWSNGKLDIVPYGDLPVTGNGYSYAPDTTPIYDLGPADFLPNQGSLGQATASGESFVAFSRADVSNVYNKMQVEYLDRANLYNPVTIYAADDAAIVTQNRVILSDLRQNHFFNSAAAASMSCALQLHRQQAAANTYQATLGRQFVLLDVGDQVSLTEPAQQLDRQLVRITDIQENADSTLTMSYEEVPLTASAPLYVRQASLGQGRNNAIPPGPVNPPLIYEPPGALSHALDVWLGASGATPANWGGCSVWISADGDTYQKVGEIVAAVRQGVLTAALPTVATTPSGPTNDPTNTLSVSLAESDGALESGTSADLDAMSTLCLVDNELIAYQTATLTGSYAYDLTQMLRGCYGTQASVESHASGAPFSRLDSAVLKWTYTNPLIGKTVYFKFTSFNVYNSNEQNLSDVAEYAYTLGGTPTPGDIAITSASLTQVGVSFTLAATWTADPLAATYVAEYSTDGGATYTAVQVGPALAFTVPGLAAGTVDLRVAGVNANSVAGPFAAPVAVTSAAVDYSAVFTAPSFTDAIAAVDTAIADVDAALGSLTGIRADIATEASGAADDAALIATFLAASEAQAQNALAQQTAAVANANVAAVINGSFSALTTTSAFASLSTTVIARLNASDADFASYVSTQAGVNTATASAISTLETTVTDNYDTLSADISDIADTVTVAYNSAAAARTDAVTSTMGAAADQAAITAFLNAFDAGQQNGLAQVSANTALAGVAQTQASLATTTLAVASLKTVVVAQYGESVALVVSEASTRASADSALASSVSTVSANLGTTNGNLATVSSNLTATQTTVSSLSADVTSLTSLVGGYSSATLSSSLVTQAGELSSLSASLTSLAATAIGVSSGATMQFEAVAAPSGAYGAWSLSVTANGEASSTAAMTVVANSDGQSYIWFQADQFIIQSSGTNQNVFSANSDGTLTLNAVTKIASTIQSLGTGGDGQPYMTMNFGSSPSIIIDDGT